jgi:RecB family exonuclease
VKYKLPPTIRRSYIDTYKNCPYRFYKEAIEKVVDKYNIYAQLGVDLHLLFDKHIKEPMTKVAMLLEYQEIFDKYSPKYFSTPELKEKMYDRGIASINGFFLISPTLPKPYKTEETLLLRLPNHDTKISCTIDRIEKERNGAYIIYDYKTGKTVHPSTTIKGMQLPLYIEAVRQNYEKEVSKFVFLYVSENKAIAFNNIGNGEYENVTEKRENHYRISIPKTLKETVKIVDKICKGKFEVNTKTVNRYYCSVCHLQQKGMCCGPDLAGWEKNTRKVEKSDND